MSPPFSERSNSSLVQQQQQQQQHHRTHGALILANIFFGVGAVLGALGLPATHPLVFALLREIGAGAILLGVSSCWYRRPIGSAVRDSANDNDDDDEKPASLTYAWRAWRVHWKHFALLGLVVFGNQAGFIVGIKMAGPITASIWQPTQPIFTAAICMTLGWEPPQRKRLVGILVATIGCIMMVLLKASTKVEEIAMQEEPVAVAYKKEDNGTSNNYGLSSTAARYVIGNTLFFCNCLCTALYVILSKRMLAIYPAVWVTAWSYNAASVYMFFATLLATSTPGSEAFFCPECPVLQDPLQRLVHIPSGAIPALLYYIVFASVGSYGLITWANQHATGTLVMSYSVLQPVTSALLTTVLLLLGIVASCQRQDTSGKASACLDFPSLGTFCGMVGVLAGLSLIITTEPGSTRAENKYNAEDPEVVPLTRARKEEIL